jgi:hypothetical protein
MRRLAILMTAIAIVASACGGNSQGTPRTMTGPLVIAAFNPFSGSEASFGPEAQDHACLDPESGRHPRPQL